jgi:DNA-nicking Smr family endonuclease
MDERSPESEEIVQIPVDGVLDLHAFNPKDVRELIPEYLAACREKGILEVRLIHGKGTGALQRTVHAQLDRLGWVASYRLAGGFEGGWGATNVTLMPEEICGNGGGEGEE